jgi:hypothetical protein
MISAFDCGSRHADTELTATVKRLGVFSAHEEKRINDFFELKFQPTLHLSGDNLAGSTDTLTLGSIQPKQVLGRVIGYVPRPTRRRISE